MVHLSEVGSMWLEEGAVQVLLAGVWLREYGFGSIAYILFELSVSFKCV